MGRGGGTDREGRVHQPLRQSRQRRSPVQFQRLSWWATRKGRVGVGLGKAGEVADAIRKGGEWPAAHGPVSLKDATIPHEVFSHYCGAKVLLRPASPGTGIIAGKTVRAVLESAGVKDVLSKSLGSKNAANVVKATLKALLSLRLREDIYRGRGLEIKNPPPPLRRPPGPELLQRPA
jgi:small subunit ribosomal protein S5